MKRHSQSSTFACDSGRTGLLACGLALLWLTSGWAGAEEPAPAAGPATGTVDFSGVWKLDLARSRSPEFNEILAFQGINRLFRGIANRTVVTQTLRQEAFDVLHVEIKSAFITRRETQYLDGRETTTTNLQGQAMLNVSTWTDGGAAIVTKAKTQNAEGTPALLIITRELGDEPDTMYLDMELQIQGRTPIKARRVFIRAPGQ